MPRSCRKAVLRRSAVLPCLLLLATANAHDAGIWRIEPSSEPGSPFLLCRACATNEGQDGTGVRRLPPAAPVVIRFPYASAGLDEKAKARLHALARRLPADTKVRITGYTDASTGPDRSIPNSNLARARAYAVKTVLLDAGIPREHVSASGKPLCCYVATNLTPAGRRRNRRVEIQFTPHQPASKE